MCKKNPFPLICSDVFYVGFFFFPFHMLEDTPHLGRIALLGWHHPNNTDQLSSALLLQKPKERRGGQEENETGGSAARSGQGDKGPDSDLVLVIQPGMGWSPRLRLQQPLRQWLDVTWTCKMPPGKSHRRNRAWVWHPKEEHLQRLVLPRKVWVKLPVNRSMWSLSSALEGNVLPGFLQLLYWDCNYDAVGLLTIGFWGFVSLGMSRPQRQGEQGLNKEMQSREVMRHGKESFLPVLNNLWQPRRNLDDFSLVLALFVFHLAK